MLKSESTARRVQQALGDVSFTDDNHQAIVTYLYAYYEDGHEPDLSDFLNFINDDQLKQIVAEIGMMTVNEDITDKEFNDYINHVLNYHKLLKIKEKEMEGKLAEKNQDYKKAAEIAQEIIALKKML